MNMQAMLKQMQSLQKDVMKIKDEIDSTEFVGESSLVKVTMLGTKKIIKVDENGKEPGRGAYICYDMECLEKAKKNKRLDKALDTKINDEIYEKLKNVIEKKTGGDVIG